MRFRNSVINFIITIKCFSLETSFHVVVLAQIPVLQKLFLSCSDRFGFLTKKSFSCRDNKHCFVMLKYAGINLIISHVKIVFTYCFVYFPRHKKNFNFNFND